MNSLERTVSFTLRLLGVAAMIMALFAPNQVWSQSNGSFGLEANLPPMIPSISSPSVFEGDSLILNISSYDPEGAPVQLSCIGKPSAAEFAVTGDGTGVIKWQPQFVGPASSDGSPFTLTILASDGEVSSTREVVISVINRNRRPVISMSEAVSVEAGNSVDLIVTASDPDFEPITWEVNELPAGASFDYQNPGRLEWTTTFADSGLYEIEFVATDPAGAADTVNLATMILSTAVYSLVLGSDSAYPGDHLDYEIHLNNLEAVTSFDLLINYDPTILTAIAVSNELTRSADFEYFQYSFDEGSVSGNLRIVGIADQSGNSQTAALAPGDGMISKVDFRVAGNISYQGLTTPVRFIFPGGPANPDNTLLDAAGVIIQPSSITYFDGDVKILKIGDIRIGDINLNGLGYEISDAIYFSNFYMDPYTFSMNPLQLANSDINRDNMVATIADLVALINIIVTGEAPSARPFTGAAPVATFSSTTIHMGARFDYEASFNVGGMLMAIQTDQVISPESIRCLDDDMSVVSFQADNELRILIYSLSAHSMPSGSHPALQIDGLTNYRVTSVSMSTADGRMADLVAEKRVQLPGRIELSQNYPNPFNPETQISFSIPEYSHVQLAIYDLLGREVILLLNENMSAGSRNVTWDGRNKNGQVAASGIYYYRLETAAGTLSRKMMLLK